MAKEFELDPYLRCEIELYVLKEYYKESSNPLFAWKAMHFCLNENYNIPEWVLKYFKKTVSNIMELVGKSKNETIEDAPDKVYRALGMSQEGSRNVFSSYSYICEKDELVSSVCSRTVKQIPGGIMSNEMVTHAIKKVAEDNRASYEKVRAAYYKWKKNYAP